MSVSSPSDITILERLLLDALLCPRSRDLPDRSPGGTEGIFDSSAADADRRQRNRWGDSAGIPERRDAGVDPPIAWRHAGACRCLHRDPSFAASVAQERAQPSLPERL